MCSLLQSKLGKVAFLFSKDPVPAFNEAALAYRGKLIFATTDGSVSRLNDHVGVSASLMPHVIILVSFMIF